MQARIIALGFFAAGAFLMFVHSALPFLWALVGIPLTYPLAPTEGMLAMLPAFTPPIGALLMLVAGLIYGRKERR